MLIQIAAVGLCLVIVVTATAFWAYCCRVGGQKIQFFPREFVLFGAFSLLGLIFFTYIICQNHYIYYWDYSGYWVNSYTTMESLFQQPLQTLINVYRSVLYDDYNLLLPLLIALPMKILGYTFVRYTVINYLFFLLPTWFVLLCIVKKIAQNSGLIQAKNTFLLTISTLLFLFTFSGFYIAIFRGYIDIACLLPASVAILLFIDYDPCMFHKSNVVRDVLVSLNLLLSFLFRRYFAYFVVGYMTAWICYAVYRVVTCPGLNQKRNAALRVIQNLLVIGGVAFVILLVLFRDLLFHVLGTDYAAEYVAYDAPLEDKLQSLSTNLGAIYFILAIVGIVLAFACKKARKICLFLTVSIVISAAAFFRVQNMGCHHIYIIAVPLFILSVLGSWGVYILLKSRARSILFGICLLVGLLSFSYDFFPWSRPVLDPISKLFPAPYYPLQRNDISELQNLTAYLNEISSDEDKKVYILASGGNLNNSILYNMDLPEQAPAVKNLLFTADVDLRDGFPVDFLRADIVVTTDPIELHLREGTQEAVRYLAEQITDSTSAVGRHFEKIDQTYTLDHGVKVFIYRKISAFETGDLESLAAYYDSLYPDQKELFYDRILG